MGSISQRTDFNQTWSVCVMGAGHEMTLSVWLLLPREVDLLAAPLCVGLQVQCMCVDTTLQCTCACTADSGTRLSKAVGSTKVLL